MALANLNLLALILVVVLDLVLIISHKALMVGVQRKALVK